MQASDYNISRSNMKLFACSFPAVNATFSVVDIWNDTLSVKIQNSKFKDSSKLVVKLYTHVLSN